MKRSGAIWLVVGVVAVAAVLMYFVVLPQVRDGKTVEEIAKKAEETVKDVKQAVNDAAKQVEDVADGAEEIKAAALVKMQRIGQDAKGAADELKAMLDKGTPSPEELAAAKAKLAAALKSWPPPPPRRSPRAPRPHSPN
jgi:biopolymer transport protein ExbB/TolQ